MRTDRRTFLAASAGAPFLTAAGPSLARARATELSAARAAETETAVSFRYDFAPVSPRGVAARLATLAARSDDVEDQYLKGGAVRRLEVQAATLFGKADALFLPTGAMANSLALRLLCGEHRRALVQRDSHVYLDEGDASAVLGGIALQPMAAGQAVPDPQEVERLLVEARTSPYPTPVGALSLETPVRRHNGETIPLETLQTIRKIAQRENVPMHWDGARSLMSIGTPGFDLFAVSALFDTVYLSLYKYLGAPYGAVLAGPAEFIERARELRHIYGGATYQSWQAALPALDALATFDTDIRAARIAFEQVLAGLDAAGGFAIERVPNGSNIAFLRLAPAREQNLVTRLKAANIQIKDPVAGRLPMTLNLSVLRRSPDDIVRAFARS